MSSFPPKQWAVRYLCDMDPMECTAREDKGISMEAFLAVKPAGGQEGSFRFALSGPEKVKLGFNIENVLPSGLFAGMAAVAKVVIADHVQLMKNSVCTKWMDVLELVRSQDIQILDGLGEDVSEEFIHAMDCYKKDVLQQTGSTDRAGISFQWLIGNKKGETEVLLMAQVRHVVYCCVLQYSKIQYDTTFTVLRANICPTPFRLCHALCP